MNFTIFAVFCVVLDPVGVLWFSEGSDVGLSSFPGVNILKTKSIHRTIIKTARRDLSQAKHGQGVSFYISRFRDFQF